MQVSKGTENVTGTILFYLALALEKDNKIMKLEGFQMIQEEL